MSGGRLRTADLDWATYRDHVMARVGDTLRETRREARLTQEELADGAGLSRTQITNLEAGRTDTSITTLYALAEALGVEAADLLP